jgi:hypothetical protein
MGNVSDKICIENPNTNFMFKQFFLISCCVSDNVEKFGIAGHATDANKMLSRKDAFCMSDN